MSSASPGAWAPSGVLLGGLVTGLLTGVQRTSRRKITPRGPESRRAVVNPSGTGGGEPRHGPDRRASQAWGAGGGAGRDEGEPVGNVSLGTREAVGRSGPEGTGAAGEGRGAWRQQPPRSAALAALTTAVREGGDVSGACRHAGAEAAASGQAMEEALEGVALTLAAVVGRRPDFTEAAA